MDRAASTLKFRPSLSFEGPVGSVVDEDTAADLLAVLSEMLSNTARHAQATQVTVSLSVGEQVDLDSLSVAGPLPVADCRENPDGGEEARENVDDCDADLLWLSVGGSCDAH